MLHRMALRVLPSLSLAVTEESVRKRKRLVMLVSGAVVFLVYRMAKDVIPLADPFVLLAVSGVVSLVTAFATYRVGRLDHWQTIIREDGPRILGWVLLWVGAVYGVQLSLLVLALLWVVGYNYFSHPDGPAMMAIMVACASVARDAFEIGHVRRFVVKGRPFPTFPDGAALRALVRSRARSVGAWVGIGTVAGALAASLDFVMTERLVIVPLVAVSLSGSVITLCAYLEGMTERATTSTSSWRVWLAETKLSALLKYWWWPGLAFSSTYYLVAMGMWLFLFQFTLMAPLYVVGIGALVGGVMALYGYYLGHRRLVEEQEGQRLKEGLLRCPFVMGILGGTNQAGRALPTAPGSKGVA
ncbi:MAG: hypothetical protein NNA18_01990 [Nitrospira sp.]|nr:hypothetical protein [Nitrospira sp.]